MRLSDLQRNLHRPGSVVLDGVLTPRLLATAIALLLWGCGQQAPPRAAEQHASGVLKATSAWSLYVSDAPLGRGGWRLGSIDRLTLQDVAGREFHGFGYPMVSADGSTLAWIDYDHLQDGKAHVVDASSGRERANFGSLDMHGMAGLSPNGSALLVLSQQGWGWELVRATDGHVMAKMNWNDPCCGPYLYWQAPDGRYMYRVLTAGAELSARRGGPAGLPGTSCFP
jgi:hypothetical protein